MELEEVQTFEVPKTYTLEEYEALSFTEDYRYELVEGKLVKIGAPGDRHGRLTGRFFKFIDNFLDDHPIGVVYTNCGFVLDRANPKTPTVRIPDVGYIVAERVPTIGEKAVPVPPDLAIEIVSPSDIWANVEDKIAEYFKYGVKMVWIVPPRSHLVEVHLLDVQKPVIYGLEDELDGGELITGFKLKVSDLFDFRIVGSNAEASKT